MLEFRKATPDDLEAIVRIYDQIHDGIEQNKLSIGWLRDVYPTAKTCQSSIALGDMFVEIDNDQIVAAGRINQEQVPEYADAAWQYNAPDDQVMVMHTLVVDQTKLGQGYASAFVRFYESYALRHHCPYLRIDTNAINTVARKLYKFLGYQEVSIVPCVFNGIPDVALVCIEKKLN